jgi:prepilin-type N-terminal cleavage/methylation domain-containing protein
MNDKGFSLIELLAVLSIMVVVIGLGYSLYFIGVKSYAKNADQIDIQQNVRSAAAYIHKKLLSASEDEVFVIRGEDSYDALQIGDEYFELKGTTLRVNHDYSSGGSTFNPMAEGITELSVDKHGKQVIVTISGGTVEQDNFFTMTVEIVLRT